MGVCAHVCYSLSAVQWIHRNTFLEALSVSKYVFLTGSSGLTGVKVVLQSK